MIAGFAALAGFAPTLVSLHDPAFAALAALSLSLVSPLNPCLCFCCLVVFLQGCGTKREVENSRK